VINYLGNYVEVPDADINQVWPVDFSTEFNRPIDIEHAAQEPLNAHVSVKHRGHWFFIDEDSISLLLMMPVQLDGIIPSHSHQ
jgi:hypothetical protein